jgi:hypothetical protein
MEGESLPLRMLPSLARRCSELCLHANNLLQSIPKLFPARQTASRQIILWTPPSSDSSTECTATSLVRSHTDVRLHVSQVPCIVINLLLHLGLVFLQVGQALLQEKILLALRSDSLVIALAHQLQSRHQVGHVVRIERLQFVTHKLDLCTIRLYLLLVVLELVLSIEQIIL